MVFAFQRKGRALRLQQRDARTRLLMATEPVKRTSRQSIIQIRDRSKRDDHAGGRPDGLITPAPRIRSNASLKYCCA